MSQEDAQVFAKKMMTDRPFQDKLKAAENDEGKKALADELGLSFTAQELEEAFSKTGELSDKDLEAVAGGSSATWVSVGVGGGAAAAACGW